MMKINYLMIALVVSCAIHLNAQTSSVMSFAEKANSIMDPLVNSNNYAGNVLIVKNGNNVFSKSYGMMDEENQLANSDETRFMLASASMIFTSTAIMKLVDDRKISVNDKLSEYFPDYENANKITIHHMLAQRSGIPAWDSGMSVANFNRNKPHTTEKLIGYFKNKLSFEPGTDYAHGRSEYIMLVAIIEKVTGQTFEDYLKNEVFVPLGMYNSGHYSHLMTDADVPNLAKGYTEKGFSDVTTAPGIHWSVKTGHASIYSTAGDMSRFADALLNGKLLSEESWKTILTNYGSNVGYGWFLNPQGNHKRYQMNGRSPGFSSYFGIYPNEDLVVIMLSNRYVSLPFFVGPELASAAFDEPYETLRLSTENVTQELGNRISGKYKMGPKFYRPNGITTIKYRDGQMYSGNYPLIPVLDDNGEITAFIHRHYWSRLEFITDENGEIQLKFDDYMGQKQGFLEQWKWWIIGVVLIGLLALFIRKRKLRTKREFVESTFMDVSSLNGV